MSTGNYLSRQVLILECSKRCEISTLKHLRRLDDMLRSLLLFKKVNDSFGISDDACINSTILCGMIQTGRYLLTSGCPWDFQTRPLQVKRSLD